MQQNANRRREVFASEILGRPSKSLAISRLRFGLWWSVMNPGYRYDSESMV